MKRINSSKKQKMRLTPKYELSLSPPPFLARPVLSSQVRCLATGPQIDAAVRYVDLAAMLGLVATSATTSILIASAFRLKKIRVWCPAPFGSVSTSVASITWDQTTSDYVSPPVTKADSSVNPSKPAYVEIIPPKGSLADKWHSPGQTDGICIMTYPTGSIVDFFFNYVLDDQGGVTAGPTVAGGSLGVFYHRGFNSLQPQSVNQI